MCVQTWRLAYSVCTAYYGRENCKIRDLNYLESARKKREEELECYRGQKKEKLSEERMSGDSGKGSRMSENGVEEESNAKKDT